MYIDTEWCSFEARTHRLYITIPWMNRELCFHPWPCGCLVKEKQENGGWRVDEADFPIASVGFLSGDELEHPVTQFIAQLPQDVCESIRKYPYNQIFMLQVCAASSRGVQLLHNSPNLLWYLAPGIVERTGLDSERIHSLLGKKRRDLLGLECGRGEAWLVRLIDKLGLPPEGTSAHGALRLLLGTTGALETLRHHPALNWDILLLASRYTYMMNSPLTCNIFRSTMTASAMQEAIRTHGRILRDTHRLGTQLGIAEVDSILAGCTTWRQLNILHDRWTERLSGIDAAHKAAIHGDCLPEPPLPGTESILPITTFYDLLMEGKTMHHCVGSYVDAIRAGTSYVYKVMSPDRATLELGRDRNGKWILKQISSYCNEQPSMNTLKAVRDWLKDVGSGD